MLVRYKGGRSTNKVGFERKNYIFNQANNFICDVPDRLASILLIGGQFTATDQKPAVIEEKPVEVKEEVKENINPLECEQCGFVAKSEFGLHVHKQKHLREAKQ